jgi:hypothetical protein
MDGSARKRGLTVGQSDGRCELPLIREWLANQQCVERRLEFSRGKELHVSGVIHGHLTEAQSDRGSGYPRGPAFFRYNQEDRLLIRDRIEQVFAMLTTAMTTAIQTDGLKDTSSSSMEGGAKGSTVVLAWSSFFFALLQSVCTIFAAMSGMRLILGISSLADSASTAATADALHTDWIRIPMLGLALLGSLLNLAILLRIRYLRGRPASQWRHKPPSPRTLRMECVQFALSLATLVLVGMEEYLHVGLRHQL